MRSLGFAELLVIAGILALLFGGRRISGLMGALGRKLRETYDQAKWVYESLGGSDEEALKAEARVGERLAARMREAYPPDADQAAQGRVRSVGTKLAEHVEKRTFRFEVISAPFANAFALPGGYVFVTRPLLDACGQDDGMLAFYLGHEMGHIRLRHSAERYAAEAVLKTVAARAAFVAELLSKGYSREQEREADLEGLRLMRKAGYDPRAAVQAVKALEGVDEAAGWREYLSTHPPAGDRAALLEHEAAKA